MVIVPKGIGDDYLRISATFRDGGRFPILSFYYEETKVCCTTRWLYNFFDIFFYTSLSKTVATSFSLALSVAGNL